MILLLSLLSYSISPADSARALISIRSIPQGAIHYSQMAAAEDGAWMLEFGRLLEAAGHFGDAYSVYGIALGNSTSRETSDWLINRRAGVSPIDTTIVITTSVFNSGDEIAWNIRIIIPMPVSHPPFQNLSILETDFTPNEGVLSANIPFIAPGQKVDLSLTMQISQQPGTSRPVSEAVTDQTILWITETLKSMPVPEAYPGPCVPMSEEMRRLAEEQGLSMRVEGGFILDRTGCIFHAWNVLDEFDFRIDPLLFKQDSLLAIAHNPTDVIPLWDLGITDGYELSLLYKNPDYELIGSMQIETQ